MTGTIWDFNCQYGILSLSNHVRARGRGKGKETFRACMQLIDVILRIVASSGGYSWDTETRKIDWKVSISHEKPLHGDATSANPSAVATSSNPYGTETPEVVKVVILGAPGVGKTAIIQVSVLVWPI